MDRHGILRIGAISCLAVLSTASGPSWGQEPADAMPGSTSPLDAAIAAGSWIRHHEIETAHGIAWPAVPDESQDVVRNLYSGTPGVILFFLELGKATGDESWIDDAKRGADDLVASLPETLQGHDAGLWTGVAGQGFALHRVFLATNDEQYLEGARRVVDLLVNGAIEEEDGTGAHWNEVTDVIGGTAGIGLFLLYAADEMGANEALAPAEKAGERLVSEGRDVELAGGGRALKWAMSDAFPRLMPNFSHGTAGVCYYLATLDQALKARGRLEDDHFLNAARAGARYLLAIGDRRHGGLRIFHDEPDNEELYYLGYCHGPVGTARLFHRLAEAGGDPRWQLWAERGARSILTSGIPDQRPDGFWANVGPCCGSAGVAEFFLALHALDARPEYEVFARAMHEDIMQRATRVELPGADETIGLKWIQAEHRVRPGFLQAQTGYMQGASGVGLWLLRLHAFDEDEAFDLRLPDSPY